jgi:hypothetical protein
MEATEATVPFARLWPLGAKSIRFARGPLDRSHLRTKVVICLACSSVSCPLRSRTGRQLRRARRGALFGEHDLSTVPALRTALDTVITTSPNVIVDLSEATFIDSSTVGALIHAGTPPAGSLRSPRRPARCRDD